MAVLAADIDPGAVMGSLVDRERSTIVEVLRRRAQATPERTFLSWREGGTVERWTFAEAWHLASSVAAGLRHALGLNPGDRVATFMDNRPEFLWAWFGCHAAGCIHAPLNRR